MASLVIAADRDAAQIAAFVVLGTWHTRCNLRVCPEGKKEETTK